MIIGIRLDDEAYEVGDILPASRVWDDGEPTEDVLDGTSTVGLYWEKQLLTRQAANKLAALYPYQHAYLVVGTNGENGEDDGEVVIRNAKVVKQLY